MFKFLGKKIRDLFKGPINEKMIDELEQLFYEADLGSEASHKLADKVRKRAEKERNLTSDTILKEIKEELLNELIHPPTESAQPLEVILIVGVNGNGKTTTVAKLGHYYKKQGKKVLIAAADTFRAAATEQLVLWSEKIGLEIVKGKYGSDPAAVVFDAIAAAQHRGCDTVLIDTAGRLHTKTDLMQELEKIARVSGKALPGAPHKTLLILDATIGQNGVEQAEIFHKFTPLSGLVLTKIDGTAKGGTAIAIQKKLKLPILFLGTGESMENLELFDPSQFINDLFSDK